MKDCQNRDMDAKISESFTMFCSIKNLDFTAEDYLFY